MRTLRIISMIIGCLLATTTTVAQGVTDRLPVPVRVRVAGGLSGTLTSYQSGGMDTRRSPWAWLLSGNLNIVAANYTIPITLVASEQSRDFAVPFRRYGMSPRWKWATGHFGYRSLSFSPYTVGGATFLGAAVELEPGPLRLAALYGRFQKARDDTTGLDLRQQYRRTGYGIKAGFGSDRTFVDLIFFKAADDTLSLTTIPDNPEIRPRDNVVIGLNTSVTPVSQLTIFGEAALSGLNRDLHSPRIDDSKLPSIILRIFEPRESVQATLAARGGLTLSLARFGVTLEYQRIEPDYETLGSYHFNSDVESITVTPRLSIWNGQLSVSVTGGSARNNLFGDLLETTNRVVAAANVSVRFGRKFSLTSQFGNFTTDQRAGRREIQDSTRVQTVSRNVSTSPRLTLRGENRTHTISGRFAYQAYTQISEQTLQAADATSRSLGLNYAINIRPTSFKVRFSLTHLQSEVRAETSNATGLTGSFGKGAFDGKLNLDLRLGYRTRRTGGNIAGMLNGELGLTYSATRSDTISMRARYGGRLIDPVEDARFSEVVTTLTYSRRF